jgi:head-tail adaptor
MARGDYRHVVMFQNPGPPVPDGDGGYTQTWTDYAPAAVSITPAAAADLERLAPGTVISTASHLVRGDFLPGVTTQSRMLYGMQVFAITGVVNVDLRNIEMICGAVEEVA